MTYGPIQMVAIGFDDADIGERIIDELWAVREAGIIRLVDLLFVAKDEDGEFEVIEVSDISDEEAEELGSIAGALIGLGAYGVRGANVGEELGGLMVAQNDFGISFEEAQALADEIPAGSAAAIALFEHQWAAGLKEAVLNRGGYVLANGMVTPQALMQLGDDLARALEAST